MKYLTMAMVLMVVGDFSWAAQLDSGDEVVHIYGHALNYRLQENGKQQYNKLFNKLAGMGLDFTLTVRPLTRVMRKFGEGSGCFFPTSLNAIKKSAPQYASVPLVASAPVDQISLRVFTRAGAAKITQLEQLNDKRVALWAGLDPEIFLAGLNPIVEITPSEEVRVRMLEAGRIDAILGFTPDVLLAADALSVSPPQYDENLALFRDEGASVVCHDSPATRAFVQQFDKHLAALKHSGELRAILGPYVEIIPASR